MQVHGMWNFSSGIANPQPKNRSQAGKLIPFFWNGNVERRESCALRCIQFMFPEEKQDCKGNFPPPPRGAKSKENVCPFLV